jgi:uncharacterized phosphosugar-binding protein
MPEMDESACSSASTEVVKIVTAVARSQRNTSRNNSNGSVDLIQSDDSRFGDAGISAQPDAVSFMMGEAATGSSGKRPCKNGF